MSFASSTEARDRGISIIHQELSLAPNLSVRDNIFLGREIRTATGVDYAEEARQARALMLELEEDIDPLTPVEDLRLGQQQIVEIARALSVDSRILIMDEPTSALSASEVEVLFKVIRDLNARGVSIVYISHHLEEALEITHHAVVLRDGAMTASAPRAEIDLEWIVRNMVGENFDLGAPPTGYDQGEVALSIKRADRARAERRLRGGRPDVARRARRRDRLHLRADGRGPHRAIWNAWPGGSRRAAATMLLEGEGRLAARDRRADRGGARPRSRGPAARRPRADHVASDRTCRWPASARFTRGLFTSRPREKALVADAIRDVHIKTDGGGCSRSARCRAATSRRW